MDGVEVGWLVCGDEGGGGTTLGLHFLGSADPRFAPGLGLDVGSAGRR